MHQKYITTLTIAAFLLVKGLSLPEIHAQCKDFVKTNCIPQLAPYIHDGNYQAVMMNEGEGAEIYKTIFAGQKYRMFVCIDNDLPNVEFVVSDIRRNILFDNRKSGDVMFWDFKSDASQQIKITVRIPKSNKQNTDSSAELIHGCVSLLFGLLEQ